MERLNVMTLKFDAIFAKFGSTEFTLTDLANVRRAGFVPAGIAFGAHNQPSVDSQCLFENSLMRGFLFRSLTLLFWLPLHDYLRRDSMRSTTMKAVSSKKQMTIASVLMLA